MVSFTELGAKMGTNKVHQISCLSLPQPYNAECGQTQIFTWVVGIQNQILVLTQHIVLLNEPSPQSPQVSFEIYNYHPKHAFIYSVLLPTRH